MVAPPTGRVKPGPEEGASAPPDPRVLAFCRYCNAVDLCDVGRMQETQRELRALGYSLVYIGQKGGRN